MITAWLILWLPVGCCRRSGIGLAIYLNKGRLNSDPPGSRRGAELGPRVERPAVPGQLLQALGRLVAPAQGGVTRQLLDDRPGADRIRPAQDPAAERREADAQDQAHVDVARLAHDALLEDA